MNELESCQDFTAEDLYPWKQFADEAEVWVVLVRDLRLMVCISDLLQLNSSRFFLVMEMVHGG